MSATVEVSRVLKRRAAVSADPIALPWASLAPQIGQRLRAEGIETCAQWRALGAGRERIFGITGRMRLAIAAAIAAVLDRGTS